jgi:L-amino acid N-acyltransferase YncA
LLGERPTEASISHKKMPSWSQHVHFVESKPYKKWFIVYSKGERVGSYYLTHQNEIGIAVKRKHHGKGIGKAIMKHIVKTEKGRLLANISPKNIRSMALFVSLGFKHIQNTYELAR